MGVLNRAVTHGLGHTDQDGARCHHATRGGMWFNTYELFVSVFFHSVFSDGGWLRTAETTESKTVDEGRRLNVKLYGSSFIFSPPPMNLSLKKNC